MRRTFTVLLSAAALAVPTAGGAATALQAAKKKVVTKKLVGKTVEADRWGTVSVNITLKSTTVGGSKKATKHFTDLGGSYSYHTDRSQFIMSQSLPILRQEFLTAQTANIQTVSGATYTSQAFEQSLQSALAKA